MKWLWGWMIISGIAALVYVGLALKKRYAEYTLKKNLKTPKFNLHV